MLSPHQEPTAQRAAAVVGCAMGTPEIHRSAVAFRIDGTGATTCLRGGVRKLASLALSAHAKLSPAVAYRARGDEARVFLSPLFVGSQALPLPGQTLRPSQFHRMKQLPLAKSETSLVWTKPSLRLGATGCQFSLNVTSN